MKQQYIDKIREACIKANPEIMELKFGCEVKIIKDSENIVPRGQVRDFVFESVNGHTIICTSYDGVSNPKNPRGVIIHKAGTKLKAVGRPIQLADVLLAIQNKKFGQPIYKVGGLAKGGSLIIDEVHWKLRSSLEDQSEETLKFISELLTI